MKQLAESGALNSLHARVEESNTQAYSNYNGIKDRLTSILFAIEHKEDEIYAEAMEKYPELKLRMHKTDQPFLSCHSDSRAYRSMDNIKELDRVRAQ